MKMVKAIFATAVVIGKVILAGELPADYARLDWIRSSGTQYIDTQVVLPEDAVIEAEMTVQKEQPQNWAAAFGARAPGASTATCEFDVASGTGVGFGRYRWIRANLSQTPEGGQILATTASFYGQRNRIRCSLRDLTWQAADGSGDVEQLTVLKTSGDCQCPLYIFALNEMGTVLANTYAAIQLYSFKIFFGETCVRDFVPCRRRADGKAGLYDCAQGGFYENGGTGVFMGSDMPAAMLSWLHSSGSQYVNVAYAPLETDAVCGVIEVAAGGKNWATAFGARENLSGNYKHALELDVVAGAVNKYRYWCGMDVYGTNSQFYNQPVEVMCSGGSCSWRPWGAENFTEILQGTSSGDCLRPLYVFAQNDGDNPSQYATMKLHLLDVISSDSTQRRRLRPARDASGNLGLFDLVENHFYPNLGVTTFAWSGIAYTMNGTTLVAHEGTLTSADLAGFTALEKATPAPLEAGAVTNLPPFTLGEGVYVLADGEQRVYDVAGTLTLRGGAHLKLDLTRTGCDVLVAQNLNLDEASSENPFIIDLSSVEGAGLDDAYPIIRSAGLVADMAGKMKVVGVPDAGVKVENGEVVVFYADPTIPVVAVWTGAGVDPGNVADPANWSCTNGLGTVISAVPGVVTSVRLPDGCSFSCTNGAPFVCRELILPATIDGDRDWRGVSAPLVGTMRLNGHKLQLSVLDGLATITDGDYQRLEFIESTGTQWIRTGYVPTAATRVECEIVVNSSQSVAWPAVFGSRNRTNGMRGNELIFFANSGSKVYYPAYAQCGDLISAPEGSFPYNEKVELGCCGNRAEWWWHTGETVTTNAIEIAGTPHVGLSPLDIFNSVDDSADGENSFREPYPCRMKLFRFRIYEGTTLVRDFVPVRQIATGKLGLLDLAASSGDEEAFYPNAGTGEFKPGCAIEDPTGGEVHVDVPAGMTNENVSVTLSGNVRLFKEGEGVYLATSTGNTSGATHVLDGTLVSGHSAAGHGFELGAGDVFVADGARVDIDYDHGNRESYPLNEVTHGRTFHFAGDGPDGEGALFNSNLASTWGATFGRLVLTGDASVGGGYFSVFPQVDSAVGYLRAAVEGPYTLTVKTPADRYQNSAFRDCDFALKRLEVRGGTQFQRSLGGTIAEGVHLHDGSLVMIGATCTFSAGIRFFVDDGTATMTTFDGTVTTYGGGVTVLPESSFDFANGSGTTANLGGVITNAGTIVRSGAGAVNVVGTLVGDGALVGGIRFAGTESCWRMSLGEEGWRVKADMSGVTDANYLSDLGRLEVVCETVPSARSLVVCAARNLTQEQLNAIRLDVRTVAGASVNGCWLGLEDGNLVLHLADAEFVRTAVWRGDSGAALDDPANWLCSNEVAEVTGLLPMAATRVVLPDHSTFVCTNGAPLVCAELVLPATLGGASDLRGVMAPFSGRVYLNGNSLRVSHFTGAWEVEDGQYLPLDYLESSGTQYINTQVVVVENAKIEAEMTVPLRQPMGWGAAFGARSHVGNTWNQSFEFDVCRVANGEYRLWRGTDAVGKRTDFYNQRIFVSTQLREFSWKPSGETDFVETIRCAQTSGNCIYPMFLFCLNENGGAGNFSSVRIHSFKIVVDEVVVCDLVPVKRLSDGALGMLDRANGNAFRENAGTGTFVEGPALPLENPGELRIDVPARETVENATVALSGMLRVVKEGAGTFVAVKQNQNYLGGTVVLDGVARAPLSGSKANTNCARWRQWGTGTIRVESGATFDTQGNYDYSIYLIELNGGTLANAGCNMDYGIDNSWGCNGSVVLTTNAYFSISHLTRHSTGVIDLGGHSLDLDIGISQTFSLEGSSSFSNGLVRVTSGGWFAARNQPKDMRTVDFSFSCALKTEVDMDVHDLAMIYSAEGYMEGDGSIKIHGTYTPYSNYIHNFVLEDGSAIDFSARSTTLDISNGRTLSFAEGATIEVKVPDSFRTTNPLINWQGHPPANLDGLSFVAPPGARYRLEADENGLFAVRWNLVILVR